MNHLAFWLMLMLLLASFIVSVHTAWSIRPRDVDVEVYVDVYTGDMYPEQPEHNSQENKMQWK